MNNIYAIIVLYDPEEITLNNIKNIIGLTEKTFVIVNSCKEEILCKIKELSCCVIENSENLGLSKALNIGISKCIMEEDCSYIALFDQDSMPASDSLEILLGTLLKHTDKIAAIGPSVEDIKNNTHHDNKIKSVNEVEVIISSGSLIPVSVLTDIGLMDETLFIDYIDYEWCLRAKSKGYKVLQDTNAILYHNMGDSFVTFFGLHKPLHKNKLRHYYIIRNQLILLNRNYVSIYWKLIHIFKLMYRIPAYLLFSDDRKQTFSYVYKAFKDFILNKKDYKTFKY